MQGMRNKIVARIERLGEGKAFSAKDFLDIASRTTIDVTLASLTLMERSVVSGVDFMTCRRVNPVARRGTEPRY